eukprot:6163435-Pyramimonas_sp.AAC.1
MANEHRVALVAAAHRQTAASAGLPSKARLPIHGLVAAGASHGVGATARSLAAAREANFACWS